MEAKKLSEGKQSEKKTETRIEWRNKFEFAFNVLGYNVGIGNVWRFSYLCFKNGGGAFLVPYLLTAILAAIPLLFLEVSLGQFTRHGCIAAWDILPLMRGIGLAQLLMSAYCSVYFVLVMAWCIFYMIQSFTLGPLPWTTCGNWWNSENCVPVLGANATFFNTTENTSLDTIRNESGISSPVEYWDSYVLQRSSGINDMGGFSNWKIFGCFLASWLACYLCIFKGIRTSGKAAYITVICPYVLMLVLFIRGVMLEGAGSGVLYYITPNITKLADPEVWLDGGSQVLFSTGVCFGGFYGFGSHNKKTFDSYKSAYFFVGACCGSSLFFGFVVFCYAGHMAHVQKKELQDMMEGGPGLVFQVFPTEFASLTASPVWSVMFFLCMAMLAIDGVFCMIEGIVIALADYWPEYFGHKGTRLWRAGICLVAMLLGIPQLTDCGIYIFELLNMYSASGITILGVAIFEAIAVIWLYGADKFYDNVKSMIGYYPPVAMKHCLKFVTPGLCMTIFIASCLQYSPLKLGSYVYPIWADAIGWLLSLSVLLSVPVVAVKTMLGYSGSWKQKWEKSRISKIPEEPIHDDKESENKFLQELV